MKRREFITLLEACAGQRDAEQLFSRRAGHFRLARYSATSCGMTIGLGGGVRLAAGAFGRRGSSPRLMMRGTPFGQPDLLT